MAWWRAIFEDWDFRSGVKFALAGCLSLYVALLLKLENPGWAVTTAFVLSTPRFVGAIVEKTVLRIFGSLAGVIVGYLLTGSLQQNPVIFLCGMGLLVGGTTALYGGTFAPYFFRQMGYTATIVASEGMLDPQNSWAIGLARFQEVLVGIAVTAVVVWVLWPRYARADFVHGVQGVLRSLRNDLAAQPLVFGGAAQPLEAKHWMPVMRRVAALEKMIHTGLMESKNFRLAEEKVNAVVAHLSGIILALSRLGQSLPENSPFRSYLEKPAQRLHTAFLRCFDALIGLENLGDKEQKERALAEAEAAMEKAWAEYDTALDRFTLHRVGDRLTTEESLEHAAWFAAASSLREELRALLALREMLEVWEVETLPVMRLEKFRWPSRDWWVAGLRGALAVVSALFLLNWLQPPGGAMIVVGTYLFTAFMLESSDRRADAAVIGWFGQTSLVCLVYFFALLLLTPYLAFFWVQLLVLGGIFYVTGVAGNRGTWTSEQVLLALMLTASMMSLNAQKPVDFQAIVGAPFGLFLAAALATIFRRTVFPFLPQRLLQCRLRELLELTRTFLQSFPAELTSGQRKDFLLKAAAASQYLPMLKKKTWTEEQTENWRKFFRSVFALGSPFLLKNNLARMPWRELPEEERLTAEAWRQRWENRLAGWEAMVTDGKNWREDPLCRTQEEMRDWVARTRQWIRAPRAPLDETMMQLGALHAWTLLARASDEGAAAAEQVRPNVDFRDTRL